MPAPSSVYHAQGPTAQLYDLATTPEPVPSYRDLDQEQRPILAEPKRGRKTTKAKPA